MEKNSRIYIAGHTGLVGSAVCRALAKQGYTNLQIGPRVDLRNQGAVSGWFRVWRPEYVFLAAAKVGGILANSQQPAEFLRDNLAIQTNVIDSAYRHGVKKLLFLGSSCIYPKLCPQPIKEEYLLTGLLEPTNEAYAIAKIAGIKMCQAYRAQYGFSSICLMPTNLYGPGDNFDLNTSHVIPALIRKAHDGNLVIWGTGRPRREFLHVDDLADAAIFLMLNYDSPEIINVGTGVDITIKDLAGMVARIVGLEGLLMLDLRKPDGTPQKLLDVSKLAALGWTAKIQLEDGIKSTCEWYLKHVGACSPAVPVSYRDRPST